MWLGKIRGLKQKIQLTRIIIIAFIKAFAYDYCQFYYSVNQRVDPFQAGLNAYIALLDQVVSFREGLLAEVALALYSTNPRQNKRKQ